jgi:hypothetical protein
VKLLGTLLLALLSLVAPMNVGEAVISHGGGAVSGYVVTSLTMNFVPRGNYPSGSKSVGGTLYFSIPGGCAPGTQIASLVATAVGNVPFAGSFYLTGTDAAKFTVVGDNPGALECATTIAGGTSLSFTIQAGSAGFTRSVTAYHGQTYYLAASGCSDSNDGLSGSDPWCSPNHAVRCGDFIISAAGSYNSSNFAGSFGGGTNKWGTVTCPGDDNVARIVCAAQSGCGFSSFQYAGAMEIASNFWGVQGWYCHNPTGTSCFTSDPPTNTQTIHHIFYGNDTCDASSSTQTIACFETNEYNGGGSVGNDYVAWIGNIAYWGVPGASYCGSNFTNAGAGNSVNPHTDTNFYFALNISYLSTGGLGCDGPGTTSDATGMEFDSPGILSFTGTTVLENNLIFKNGGQNLKIYTNQPPANGSTILVIIRYNTIYAGMQNAGFNGSPSDLTLQSTATPAGYMTALITDNIIEETASVHAASSTGTCNYPGDGGCVYPINLANMTPQSIVDDNWFDGLNAYGSVSSYSPYSCLSGPNVATGTPTNVSCDGNVLGTDAAFTATFTPTAPPSGCAGYSSTLACMATPIGYFVPTATGTTVGGGTVSAASMGFNSTPACDQYNATDWIKNLERGLPAALDPCG